MGIFGRVFLGSLMMFSLMISLLEATLTVGQQTDEYIWTQQCSVKTSFAEEEGDCLPLFAPQLSESQGQGQGLDQGQSVASVCLHYVPQEGALSVEVLAKEGYTLKSTQFWAGLDPSRLPMSSGGRTPDYAEFQELSSSQATPFQSFLYKLQGQQFGCTREEFSLAVSLRTFVSKGRQGKRVKTILTSSSNSPGPGPGTNNPYLVNATVACSCPVGPLTQEQEQLLQDQRQLYTSTYTDPDYYSSSYYAGGPDYVQDFADWEATSTTEQEDYYYDYMDGNQTSTNSTDSDDYDDTQSPAPTISPAPSAYYGDDDTNSSSTFVPSQDVTSSDSDEGSSGANNTNDDTTYYEPGTPAPTISPAPSASNTYYDDYDANSTTTGSPAPSPTGGSNSTTDESDSNDYDETPAPTISPAPSSLVSDSNGTDYYDDEDTYVPIPSPAPSGEEAYYEPEPATSSPTYDQTDDGYNGTTSAPSGGGGDTNSTTTDDSDDTTYTPAPTISPAPSAYLYNQTYNETTTGGGGDDTSTNTWDLQEEADYYPNTGDETEYDLTYEGEDTTYQEPSITDICVVDEEYYEGSSLSLCYALQTDHDGTVVGGQVCVELEGNTLLVTITAADSYSLFDSELWLGFQGIDDVPLADGHVDYQHFPYLNLAGTGEAQAQFTIDLQSYCQDGLNEHEVAMVCHSLIEALDENGNPDASQAEYVYGYKLDGPDYLARDDNWFGWVDFTIECECSDERRGRRLRRLQGGRLRHLRGGEGR